ncbi:hypothetical protein PS928_03902 [Pseudomonas fluorescens]|jgi:hypothetical protein|uniref:Uncharacterized protein n=1 Tax=Pseudomonas fluorescens TaxID=294 RepID=A0A5E7UNC9_PSEFL|nr:hypothetical protein PS928_03902 [Pseudomonas fluorescens]
MSYPYRIDISQNGAQGIRTSWNALPGIKLDTAQG